MGLFGWQKCRYGNFYGGGSVETIPKRIYDSLTSFYNARLSKDEPNYGLIKKRK